MKNIFLITVSILFLMGCDACEKTEIEPAPPPPTNRIDYLLVDEKDEELLIYGKFPDARGTVTMANSPLIVKQWSSALIICVAQAVDVPDNGDVVVHSTGTHSAPRTLYKWLIEFNCVRPHGGLSSDIIEKADGNITIRGDLKPAPASVFPEAYKELYFLGEIYYQAGGIANSTYDCGTMTAEWTPVDRVFGKTTGMHDLPTQSHFQGYKNILPTGFDLFLDFQAWEVNPMKVTINPCTGPSSFSEKMWSSQLIGMDGYDAIPLRFEAGTHNIKSDSITEDVYNSTQLIWNVEDGDAYRRKATLSWKCTVYPD